MTAVDARLRQRGAPADAAAAGRIPPVVRIGVTGHRRLGDPAALLPAIDRAVDAALDLFVGSGTGARIVVLSALAEGADRLVAEQVMGRYGAELEAALPLPPDDYTNDFGTAESVAEFTRLLARSRTIHQGARAATREGAYAQAGAYIVEHCDVLLAVWDGDGARGPGGTAWVVGHARERGVPVAWVRSDGDPGPIWFPAAVWTRKVRRALADQRVYNAATIRDFDERLQAERTRLGVESSGGSGPVRAPEREGALLPSFVRADVLATRWEQRFKLLSACTFLMAAGAVAVVALQSVLVPDATWVVAAEVLLLLAVLASLAISRSSRILDRWISYRYLAERLRSALFIALTGPPTGDGNGGSPRVAGYDPEELWITRALDEAVRSRPLPAPNEDEVPALRVYLAERWIRDQVGYHRRHVRRQHLLDVAVMGVVAVLFTGTLVSATLHTLGFGEQEGGASGLGHALVLVSICLPALGAALHGVRGQAGFRREAERSGRAAVLLDALADEMDAADSLASVRDVALRTERVTRQENSDWFGVMRFQDIDLIT